MKIEYAIDGVSMEVKRQLSVLDRRLAEAKYLVGDDYTVADMAVWSWYAILAKDKIYEVGEFLQVQEYKNVQRWVDTIEARPAVNRGRMVNATWGKPPEKLHQRHDASDFETKTQDKISKPVKQKA